MMKLNVTHSTRYDYASPPGYALTQIRLTPKQRSDQVVENWSIRIDGASEEARFQDQHCNQVILALADADSNHLEITCQGTVVNSNGSGIIGRHEGFAPLWYFRQPTDLTRPGPRLREFLQSQTREGLSTDDQVARFHTLSARIADKVPYTIGATQSGTNAEDALTGEAGVCQDHTHIMIALARLLGHPARYVSGYLMMNDRIEQDATHAWAEVFVEQLGWVGFDVSNGISPDERYVRVATGLDYRDAAPVSGLQIARIGSQAGEELSVKIAVQQQ